MSNILFVCHYGIFRSRIARDIYREKVGGNVKSAGVSLLAKLLGRGVNKELVEWADAIFIMDNYMEKIIQDYSNMNKKIINLSVSQCFTRLKERIETKLEAYLP